MFSLDMSYMNSLYHALIFFVGDKVTKSKLYHKIFFKEVASFDIYVYLCSNKYLKLALKYV